MRSLFRGDELNGVWLIEWLQSYSNSTLDSIVVFITDLANVNFYIFLLPLLYWCVDQAIGVQVISMLLVSMWINFFTKEAFLLPRPFWIEERVHQLHHETNMGYGFPSGHVMGATTIWGYFIIRYRVLIFTLLSIMLILLIALSRLYLGVHYLIDVVGGLVMAALLLLIFFIFDEKVQRLISNRKWLKMCLSILPLVLLLFYRNQDSNRLIGLLVGLLIGYNLLGEKLRYTVNAPLVWQGVKMVVGLSSLLIMQTLTSFIGHSGVGQVLSYTILGFFTAGVIPYLFTLLIPCLREQRLLLRESNPESIMPDQF